MSSSAAEDTFLLLVLSRGFPQPEREYRLIPGRKYRCDFAWPEKKIAVEIEGGVWVDGRHVRGVGYINDCRKYNLAQLNGWRVFRFTPDMLDECLDVLHQAWSKTP